MIPLCEAIENQIILFAVPLFVPAGRRGGEGGSPGEFIGLSEHRNCSICQRQPVNNRVPRIISKACDLRDSAISLAKRPTGTSILGHRHVICRLCSATKRLPRDRDLMDESNNPLLPGFGLGQRVAVIACNYEFIKSKTYVRVSESSDRAIQQRRGNVILQ